MAFAPAIMAIAAVASTAMQTASSVQAAKATAAGQEAEAQSIETQKQIAMRDERQRNRELLSKQLAIGAAAGVGTTTGTPLENALTSAYEGEMNALRIGYSGETQAESRRYGARVARATIPGTIAGGALKGIGSGLYSYSAMGGKFPTFGGNNTTPTTSQDSSLSTGGSLLSNWASRNYGPYDYRRYRL